MRNGAVFFAIGIAVLLWLRRGDAAPQADLPTLRPLSSIAEELKKDGTFSEEDAKTIALEVARRIWFPEPRRLKIASEPEESGGWTVRCFEADIKPATAGCSVIVSRSGSVEKAIFHHGE